MFPARFLALPAIALTVIVALAQVHSGAGASQAQGPTVHRAVTCTTAALEIACTFAGNSGTSMLR
jgi:hypothetical protein